MRSLAAAAGFAAATRGLLRLHGIDEGSRKAARLVSRAYCLTRRRWSARLVEELGPQLWRRPSADVVHDYLRHEGYRHAHRLLAGLLGAETCGRAFVSTDCSRCALPVEGAVLLGAHFGSVPFAGFGLQALGRRTLLVLEPAAIAAFDKPAAARVYPRLKEYYSDSERVIGAGGAWSPTSAAIRGGSLVLLMGDVSHRYSAGARLLGRPVKLATGPYRLARELRVPLILYRLEHLSETEYRLVLTEELNANRPEAELVLDYAAKLNGWIEAKPHDWSILPWYLPLPA